MVLTVLEAEVKGENWQLLQDSYEKMTKEIEPGIKNSYLVQGQKNKSIWRILTFWESQEALDAMRASGKIPTGVLIFQAAKAEPDLSIYDIRSTIY